MRKKTLIVTTLTMLACMSLMGCNSSKETTEEITTTTIANTSNEILETTEENTDVETNTDVNTESDSNEISRAIEENGDIHTSEELDAILEEYREVLNATDERAEDGTITYIIEDIDYQTIYDGEIDVMSILNPDTKMIVLYNEDETISTGIQFYEKSVNEDLYNAIIEQNHPQTDVNGNTYYTAKKKDNTAYFAAFDNDTFAIISISGNSDIADHITFMKE